MYTDFANYSIAVLCEDGCVSVLDRFDSYPEAEKRLPDWADVMPDATLGIFSRSSISNCFVV